ADAARAHPDPEFRRHPYRARAGRDDAPALHRSGRAAAGRARPRRDQRIREGAAASARPHHARADGALRRAEPAARSAPGIRLRTVELTRMVNVRLVSAGDRPHVAWAEGMRFSLPTALLSAPSLAGCVGASGDLSLPRGTVEWTAADAAAIREAAAFT